MRNILLDTGCSRTLVQKDLVPKHKLLHGEVVAIRCAHGDMVYFCDGLFSCSCELVTKTLKAILAILNLFIRN